MYHTRKIHQSALPFVREKIQIGEIDFVHVPSNEQLVYILTKPLGQEKFTRLTTLIAIVT
jgi:hypothetical protein